jgi:CheY-like chemotaxis protein
MPNPKMRILVVDDKACIQSFVSLVFADVGYQVGFVEGGLSACTARCNSCRNRIL